MLQLACEGREGGTKTLRISLCLYVHVQIFVQLTEREQAASDRSDASVPRRSSIDSRISHDSRMSHDSHVSRDSHTSHDSTRGVGADPAVAKEGDELEESESVFDEEGLLFGDGKSVVCFRSYVHCSPLKLVGAPTTFALQLHWN